MGSSSCLRSRLLGMRDLGVERRFGLRDPARLASRIRPFWHAGYGRPELAPPQPPTLDASVRSGPAGAPSLHGGIFT